MNDNNYIYKRAITPEEKINNLKEIITLLSEKLDMNLQYIDYESIIRDRDKESAKYFLVLFINILKVNETQKQKLKNMHFNNDIELLKRSCITERDKNETDNINIDISYDTKMLIERNNNKKNININEKFDNYLMNIQNNINNNMRHISKPFSVDRYKKKTDLKIFYIPPVKPSEDNLLNKNKYLHVNKLDKNHFHLYLSQKELIYEVIKIIKDSIPHSDFYDFLVNYTFVQKMLNIIEKIYYLHFLRHKNKCISKHFLKDHIIDINTIIQRELNLNKKYNKTQSVNNKNKTQTKNSIHNNNKSNRNIKELSNIFKNIPWLQKFHDFNCLRAKHELKETKMNYDYQRKKNIKYINDFQKLFLKLISVESNKVKEDKELQKFLFNIKFYQIIEQKADVIKNMRKNNKELKILKKYNLLV